MFPFHWDSKNILHIKSPCCTYLNMTLILIITAIIFSDNNNEKESKAGLN